MKKLFTLIAAIAMTMTINAQEISFGDGPVANADLPEAWTVGNVKLALTNDGKPAIDSNKAYFGTADNFKSFATRLKTGGKSSSKRFLTLTVPSKGTVKIAARTGKNSDNTRTLVLTQNDKELVNKVLDEADAIMVGEGDDAKKVYPYVTADVEAGDIVITFPVNSINFYAIEFVAKTTGIHNAEAKTTNNKTYNLAGQRVGKNYKGVVVANGKKFVQK
ncbi:MAG: hypothetical protein ACOYJK_01110 [Prevotella sp.]|jgi:hypothetical protein